MRMNAMGTFAIFAAVVGAAAYVGSRFPPDAWYRRLRKPDWNPPSWVFAPVWSLLYVAMAFAGWLVWEDANRVWTTALTFWVLQLLLNMAWPWMFFGRHWIALAAADSAALLAAIGGFMFEAMPINEWAVMLFAPYALWVAFATALNVTIVRLADGGTLGSRA